ncbi:hypothetical protein TNCV_633501 [Trichonephila clavipes]|nr:hypothetical protein TNCV_633501 [Trichonephila clavipes]
MFGTLPYDSPLPNQVKLNYPPIQQARQIAVNRTIKHHKINKQRKKGSPEIRPPSGKPLLDRGNTSLEARTCSAKLIPDPENGIFAPGRTSGQLRTGYPSGNELPGKEGFRFPVSSGK